MKELLEERIKTYKRELEGLDKEQYERHIAVIEELEYLLNKLGDNGNIRYYVKERRFNGSMFVGTVDECREFIKTELRNRNKKDGYDDYWHNADVVIIKETTISEIYEAYL